MHRSMIGVILLAATMPLCAEQVVDDFESGSNPNQWGWTNNSGGLATIVPDGGNPGAWLDSGAPYYSNHPNLTSIPAAGTPLRAALASGELTAAGIDVERLDTAGVAACAPVYTLPSRFILGFIDAHSDPGGSIIEAHTTDGPPAPTSGPFPWMSVGFTIPASAPDVPPGWVLNAPPELGYTWADLMHNIDGIRFFVVDPDELTFDSCWDLGADNIVIDYRSSDTIFTDGFDSASP